MTTATLKEETTPAQTAKDKSAIMAIIENLRKAHHDKNAPAFAAQFASGAAIFNLAPPLVHNGVDLRKKRAWFDTWEGPVGIEPRELNITVSGDIAFAHGYLRLSGIKKGADRPVAFWMRETLCLERQVGNWKIIHEHTSVPFYMDASTRPAFDLKPS
ncbi:MAG: nuclear transport factor 2 family protein [Silvibacterium sp.]